MAILSSTRTGTSASSVDSGQYNDPSWNSPHQALTGGSGIATVNISNNPYEDSDYLRISGYGFNLPENTVNILGILVTIEAWISTYDLNFSLNPRLMKSNSPVGDAIYRDNLPTTATDLIYGGSTSLWGTTWTRSEINSSGFGVSVTAKGPSTGSPGTTFMVDVVEVTVYYTAPGPSSTDRGIRITGQSLDSKAQDIRLTGYFPSVQRDLIIKGFSTSSRSQGLYVECTVRASNYSQDVRIFGQGASDRWQNLRLEGEALSSFAQGLYLEGILGSFASTDLRMLGQADSSRANDLRITGVIPSSTDCNIRIEGIGDISSSDRTLKMSGAIGATTSRDIVMLSEANSSTSALLKMRGRGDPHFDRYRPWEFRIGEWILRFNRRRSR